MFAPYTVGARHEESIVDTMYQTMLEVVDASGIWNMGRRESHGFVLSPDSFIFSERQAAELGGFAASVGEVMRGVSNIMAIAHGGLGQGRVWNEVSHTLNLDNPWKQFGAFAPKQVPRIVKVDLVEEESGRLRVVEIDAMNCRAMGYCSLFRRISESVYPAAQRFPGIAVCLAKEITMRKTDRAVFLYGHTERFYRPEFEILVREMAQAGITVVLADEVDVRILGTDLVICGQIEHSRLFFNLPQIDRNAELRAWMELAAFEKRVEFLVPPKGFLGSKALLSVLRNDNGSTEIEAMLSSQISQKALSTVREMIPRSVLIGRGSVMPDFGGGTVLKRFVSSGMKGVVMSHDPAFHDTFADACRRGGWIAQEMVVGRRREYRLFAESGDVIREHRYARIVAYIIGGQVADAVATACSTPECHGGKTAVNVGVVLE